MCPTGSGLSSLDFELIQLVANREQEFPKHVNHLWMKGRISADHREPA